MLFRLKKGTPTKVSSPFSIEMLCAGLFLGHFQRALETALFLGRNGFGLFAVESLYIEDIDTADHGFDLLLYRNGIENLVITDQGHDLRAYFGLDDGQLRAPHQLGSLVQNNLGQS